VQTALAPTMHLFANQAAAAPCPAAVVVASRWIVADFEEIETGRGLDAG